MQLFPESGDDRRLRYLVAILSTVAAFAALALFPEYFARTPFLPASLAALATLLVAGVVTAVVVEVVLALATVYLMLEPVGSFAIASQTDADRLLAFMTLFALADMLGWRLERARRATSQRERVLRESETRYRHILEQASDGIVLASPEGRMVLANARAAEMLGYTRDELLRVPLAGLYDSGELAETPLAWDELERTSVVLRERRLRRKDGSTFIAELSVRRTAEGLAQAIVRDVTERKRAEEALRAERDLLDGILATSVAGILVVDPLGRPLFLNSRAEAVIGLSRGQLADRTNLPAGWRFLNLDGTPLSDEERPARRVVATGEPVQDARLVLERPGGDYTFLSVNAAPLRNVDRAIHAVVLSLADITEQHCAERALVEREEQLQRVTGAVPGVVYQYVVGPGKDERFEFVSEQAAELLGATPQEIYADPERAWSRVLPEDKAAMQAAFARASETREPWSFEFRSLEPDGRISWMRDIATAVAVDPGRVVWNGVMINITDQRRLQEELLQSQKMDSLGRLAGGVAHDFNNLLTVIRGYADVLATQFSPEDPRLSEVREIRGAADRATSLTRQLLAVSRRQVLVPRAVDLNHLVQEMERMLGRVIGENITIITVPGRELGWVRADPSQLEQVLLNLAVNARDAMPQGGTLTLETRRRVITPGREDPTARGVPVGDYVMLSVHDTGVGMDAVTQSKIFEPFFTTKAVGEGTGLGLSTVYGIVQQSNGMVTVESEPGRGTAIRIFLPRIAETREAIREASPAALEPPQRLQRATVLLVEDDDGVRRLTRRVLEQYGFRAVEARTGVEALELLGLDHHPRVDAVVSDLVMPGMTGRELVSRLRDLRPDIPVVYLSGYTGEEVSEQIRAHPKQAFLQKPFSPDALAAALEDLLADVTPPATAG